VTADQWPATRAEFTDYWNRACGQVVIDDHIRAYLMRLVDLKMINWPLRITFAPLLRFLTIGSLARFPEQMQLSWSAVDQRRFENLFVFVAFVNGSSAVHPARRQPSHAGRRAAPDPRQEAADLAVLTQVRGLDRHPHPELGVRRTVNCVPAA
jgi:uncharacterized protein (DUF2236 family)